MDNEPLNAQELPVFDNPKDGLSFLDEQEQAAIKELHDEAVQRMDEAEEDPTKQNYFMRTDKRTVVKDDKEYGLCLKNHIPMKVIPYAHALQLLKEEEARAKKRLKTKKIKKAARSARKKNRK